MSKSKRTEITLDEWEQALSDAMTGRVDPVSKEWVTKSDFAKRQGLSHSQGGKQIELLMVAGKVEAKKFRIATGSRIVPVLHYRLKK
jgi:hypothetical protein